MIEDRVHGWFGANVRELRWQENELGATCEFDKHRRRFDEFGINLTVLRPQQPVVMYHREGQREGFLVLQGECLLIVEGQEVPFRRWDYFLFPPNVAHAIIGAGDGLSLVLAVGNRVGPGMLLYPCDESSTTRRSRKRRTRASRGRRLRFRTEASSWPTSVEPSDLSASRRGVSDAHPLMRQH